MTVYDAYAERSGDYWAVEIPDVSSGRAIFTQGRSLSNAEAMAQDAIASVLDVAPSSVDVLLHVRAAAPALSEVAKARTERERANIEEQLTLANAARKLVAQGMSQRDAARLLNISHQRISQLVNT